MNIKELIKLAYDTSPKFKEKFHTWYFVKKKKPNLKLIMKLLEEALGREFVAEQAREYISRKD